MVQLDLIQAALSLWWTWGMKADPTNLIDAITQFYGRTWGSRDSVPWRSSLPSGLCRQTRPWTKFYSKEQGTQESIGGYGLWLEGKINAKELS